MGPNPDRERSSNRPPTSNRRLFGIRTAQLAGGLAAGEVARRVLPFGVARAEAPKAPSLHEYLEAAPVTNSVSAIDSSGARRDLRLRIHPSAKLILDFNPAIDPDRRQSFIGAGAESLRLNASSAVSLVLTSPEGMPAGLKVEPVYAPFKNERTVVGFKAQARVEEDGEAVLFYAPTLDRTNELYADSQVREFGVYPQLAESLAVTMVTGGVDNARANGDVNALREQGQGLFMLIPQAEPEENPEGRPLREVVQAAPIIDSAGRAIIRSTPDSQYIFTFNPRLKEEFAWWVQANMVSTGNVNVLGIAEPKALPGLQIGASSVKIGEKQFADSIFLAHEPTQKNPDIVWAPPNKIYFEDEFFMSAYKNGLGGGMYRAIVHGLNAKKSFSPAQVAAYSEYHERFGDLLIFATK